jgi:hypothetical protein
MAAIKKEQVDQFRVSFHELAKAKRGEPVQVDPYLIARAIALVMRECTVRSAAGKPLLWNEYRMVLARRDFDLVRALQGPLERDLQQVLAQEAKAREAELVGELRITVVFDEADELRAGEGAVRVGFVPTEKLAAPRASDMTVRFMGWAVAGEIAARAPAGPADTVMVDDSRGTARDTCVLQWPGGEATIAMGATVTIGRAHASPPARFVALTGASSKVNKQHAWIAVAPTSVRIGRLAGANPVQVNGQPLKGGDEVSVELPAEISLSHGDVVLTLRRS